MKAVEIVDNKFDEMIETLEKFGCVCPPENKRTTRLKACWLLAQYNGLWNRGFMAEVEEKEVFKRDWEYLKNYVRGQ